MSVISAKSFFASLEEAIDEKKVLKRNDIKRRMSELFSRLFGEVSWCWPKDEQVKFREAQVRLGHFIYFELSGDPENQL